MTTLINLKERIQKRITHVQHMVNVYNTLASTLEPLHGKKVTKRFETICQNALPDWHVRYYKEDVNAVLQVTAGKYKYQLDSKHTDWRFYIHYWKNGAEFDFEKQGWVDHLLSMNAELMDLRLFLKPMLEPEIEAFFERVEDMKGYIRAFNKYLQSFHRITHMMDDSDYKFISGLPYVSETVTVDVEAVKAKELASGS